RSYGTNATSRGGRSAYPGSRSEPERRRANLGVGSPPMSIWRDTFPLELVQKQSQNTLVSHLGIEFIEAGDDYVKARMPVAARTHQPAGTLHGGASVVLAETLASWSATFVVDREKNYCVGLEINANHVRAVSSGWIVGTTRPIHLGRS